MMGCYVHEDENGDAICEDCAWHLNRLATGSTPVVLARRSWIGRLVRVPRVYLHHRRLGLPRVVAARLALLLLRAI